MTTLFAIRNLIPMALRRPGVLGIVLTPAGRVVLVRHTDIDGWYPPGGGRRRRETPEAAVIRELREEIGLTSWSVIRPMGAPVDGVAMILVKNAI